MKISKTTTVSFKASAIATALLAAASLFAGSDAGAGPTENIQGTQAVYGPIPPDQIEFLSTADRIKSVAASGSMTAIWETLEHGERIECVDCIPSVEPLLYDTNPQTREIAAWWLRRRLFGVFGEGEVYARTLDTLANDPDPKRRAYAANAVGEFLAAPGVDACSAAITKDGDPNVRAAAATALGRLNDEGHGALLKALADVDPRVKIAALGSAGRVLSFCGQTAVAALTADADPTVRRRAADVIGARRMKEGVDGLIALTKDADAGTRNAACHALGALHDPKAKDALSALSTSDPDSLVRDQATIALRRL